MSVVVKNMDSLEITHLSQNSKEDILALLPELYHLDIDIFTNPIDQYGLSLLLYALLQPHALWLARCEGNYLGYLSIFSFSDDILFNALSKDARKGKLDLPKIEYFAKSMVEGDSLKETTRHLYIDAVATKDYSKEIRTANVREALFAAAAEYFKDFVHLVSISVIAVEPRVSDYLKREEFGNYKFAYIGKWDNKIMGEVKFRHLYQGRELRQKSLTGVLKHLGLKSH